MENGRGAVRSRMARGARILAPAVLVAAASAHCDSCKKSVARETQLPSLATCIAGATSGPPPEPCQPFVQCLESDCESDLTTCFGSAYDAGIIEGACESFESCATENGCTPASGVTCAEATTAACQSCLAALVQCADQSCASAFAGCAQSLLSDLTDGGTTITSNTDAAADAPGPEAGTTDAASLPDALAGHDAEADANHDALPPSKTAVAMTLDPAGYLFVATNDGVDVFSPYPALAFVQSIGQAQFGTADAGTPLVSPDTVTGLAVDGDGHLLVSNYYETSTPGGCSFSPPATYGSDVVSYRDESTDASPPSLGAGTVLLGYPTPTPLGCVSGVSAKAGAAVFVTTDVSALAYDLSGNALASVMYPGSSNVNGIAADPSSSYVYAADYNQGAVYQLTLSGTTLTVSSTISINGGSSEPSSVAVDGTGNVYVSDTLSGIHIFSNAGAQTGEITSVTGRSLAIDAAGRLYVDESGLGVVAVYTNESGAWTETASINYFP
jgi:hypothetical protein